MTVVAAVIVKEGVVHVSDSWLSVDGSSTRPSPVATSSKLVRVPAVSGIIAWWGYADLEGDTQCWLTELARESAPGATAEQFAALLMRRLTSSLPAGEGIGMHFSAYESIEGDRVPEMFLITNFAEPRAYTRQSTGEIVVSRESNGVLPGAGRNAADPETIRRRQVKEALEADQYLLFNNGHPRAFNRAIAAAFREVASQPGFDRNALAAYRSILRAALRQVINDPDAPGVGGDIHDLSVTPTGIYSSTSGD